MSAFYDLASLVLVPSGYKASKVYAQKPLTTDGQLTFSRASTATRVNSAGLIETVSSNVPRLDYLGSTCPKLNLEPQRTNLATYSEAFNVGWAATASTVTTDVTAAPDGVSSADKITADTSNAIHFISKSSANISTPWTYSVFAKAAGYDRITLNTNNTNFVGFNLTTGVVESSLGTGITSASIQNYGNGWYRCSITSTSTATGSAVSIAIFNAAYTNGNTNPIFTGNGTDGVFIWGTMMEQGAYPTSYVKTEGTTVTRLADACSKTGISSLIGQTEGTLYAEIVRTQSTSADTFWITLSDGTINNWLFIGTESTGGRIYIRASNTVVFDEYPAISLGTHKIALAYKSGSIAVYIDGAQIFTSAATYTIGSLTGFALGQSQSSLTASVDTAGAVNQALLFKTRLTNAQLAELTAL